MRFFHQKVKPQLRNRISRDIAAMEDGEKMG